MKHLKSVLLMLCSVAAIGAQAQADSTNIIVPAGASCNGCCCAGSGLEAPAGIMTNHIHAKGSWTVSYTYMNMMAQGNRMGDKKVSDDAVYQNYMMAPEKMVMQMHMVMAMYGVTDRLTLMGMGGYAVNTMSMNMSDAAMSMPGMVMTPGNMTMQSASSGFTDTKVYALYNFSNNAAQRINGSLGINLPTGTIKADGTTMLGANEHLPYDMQLGTGSFGLLPDVTYVRKAGKFTLGADAGANINLGNNALGYRVGNLYHASVWAGYQFLKFMSGSLRAEGIYQDKISGSDPYDNPSNATLREIVVSDPTTSTANYGGKSVNVYAGLNFHATNPSISRFGLLVEYGMPVYQNLNGVQMDVRSNLVATLQYTF